ncbi:hypothetical protein DFP72DRAFT_1061379 [Ephemerocybe angulata]|uniref:Uncharacterized protein n=1 Tax=Ephemerocybe angulata TaxID=980116 RepID=A0A8H6ID88_9AGAR|nr:hypothetical protein DFP72DRAFT_1061379 [Tulosesus angulatus]
MSSTASTTSTARPTRLPTQDSQGETKRRVPVTPAVLRSIFASSRSPHEERSISRIAFFRFAGFLLSVVGISFAAARNRGFASGATLLGVV